MPDGWEWKYGLDPLNPLDAGFDSDNDRLINRHEYNNTAAGSYIEVDNITTTLPGNNDTDADGLLDGEEILDYLTDPTSADTDGDGMPDGWEVYYGFNPLDAYDSTVDNDEDGFDSNHNGTIEEEEEHNNILEFTADTHPFFADTDSK
jgi:hypothetical protein